MIFDIRLPAENIAYGVYRNAEIRLHKRSMEPYKFVIATSVKKMVATLTKFPKLIKM